MNSTLIPVAFFEKQHPSPVISLLNRLDTSLKFYGYALHEMEYLDSLMASHEFKHVLIYLGNQASDFNQLSGPLRELPDSVTVYVCIDCSQGKSDVQFLRSGVDGVISLSDSESQVMKGLTSFAEGKKFISDCVLETVFDFLKTEPELLPSSILSSRENEILQLVVSGHSYRVVSEKLAISIETVRTHLRNAYKKLNVKNSTQARQALGW